MSEVFEFNRANRADSADSADSADPAPGGPAGLSRRGFLGALGVGAAVAAGAGPAVGGPAAAQTAPTPTAAPIKGASSSNAKGDGIVVLLTLYGGNDGLDTVVPFTDPTYLSQRGALALGADGVLPLDGQLGLNKAVPGLKSLWDQQRLAIVRGVGYPDFNRSHFVSMDIWQSATPQSPSVYGWIGRWLDAVGHDPVIAVSVGSNLPRSFVGAKGSGSAIPVGSFRLPGGPALERAYRELVRPGAGTDLGPLGARIAATSADLLVAQRTIAPVLGDAAAGDGGSVNLEGGAVAAGDDNRSALDGQLEQISKMINAGLPTRVYGVSLGGFDTHADERGTHGRLLAAVDGALTRFFGRIATSANGAKVTVLVYSEFGRRVQANGSDGTDHGKASVVFAVGPQVRGGFYGDQPSLTDLDDGDLKVTTDFRTVYATVLERALGFESKAVLGQAFTPVAFL